MIRPDRYLRSSLVIMRCNRHGDIVLFHPGSSVILLTDTLGGAAARRLLMGRSEEVVGHWAEQQVAGAGARFAHLMGRLAVIGATTSVPPRKTARWWLRCAGSLVLSVAFSVLIPIVRLLPLAALDLLFSILPLTPIAKRTVGQIAPYVDANLQASGYADTTPQWRRSIARACAAASTRTFFHQFLWLILPPRKMDRLTHRLLDPAGIAQLKRVLPQGEGSILVGMHTNAYLTVPFALHHSGWSLAMLADLGATNVPLASAAGGRFAQQVVDVIVDSHTKLAGKTLINGLRSGKCAIIAFDAPLQRGDSARTATTIPFMGRTVYRFDGPAWLAVRSGKPIVFVGTYRRGRRVALEVMPPVYPDADLPPKERIEALTAHVYATGEAFVRRHPESWMAWCFLHDLLAPEHAQPSHGENVNAGLAHASG